MEAGIRKCVGRGSARAQQPLLQLPKSAHPALQKSRGKPYHFFHGNLSAVGDPLAVESQNGGGIGSNDVLNESIFFMKAFAFLVGVSGNFLLHFLADIVKTAVGYEPLLCVYSFM